MMNWLKRLREKMLKLFGELLKFKPSDHVIWMARGAL
jgi:hypothetical protein